MDSLIILTELQQTPNRVSFFTLVCQPAYASDIIVLENGNHRVQVFDQKGKFLFQFETNGLDEDGQFNSPYSVCTDPEDNILVTDYNNHRVQVFDKNGRFKYKLTGPSLTFNAPRGIA